MPTTPMRPGLPSWSSTAGQSHTRRHLRKAGRNIPFDPLCAATSYAPGKRTACRDTQEAGRTSRTRTMHHANTTPSASGKATAALETAAVRLRAHHRGPGCPGGLGHPAPPARTATPGTRRRAADGANQASPDVCVDHHHCSPGADHHASPFHHSEPWAASRQQTDHDHRTGHGPSAGHCRWHDNHHGALRLLAPPPSPP